MRLLFVVSLLVLALPATAPALGPGDVDSSFGTNGAVFTRLGPLAEPGQSVAGARDVAALPGGLLVTGSGPDADGRRALVVARYLPSGRLDRAFGGGDGLVVEQVGDGNDPSSAGTAVMALPDGGAIVAGNATAGNGRTALLVMRFSNSGSKRWTSVAQIDASTDAAALELTVDPVGRVVVAGRSGPDPLVARLDAATGALDPAFAGSGFVVDSVDRSGDGSGCTAQDAQATSVLTPGDGSVILGGTIARTCSGGRQEPRALLRRFSATGEPDETFAAGDLGVDRVTALSAAPFSTGVIATGTVEESGTTVPGVARITGGILDTDFPGPTGFGPLPGFAQQAGTASALATAGPEGKLLVGVDADDPDRPDRVLRTDAGGQRDPRFSLSGVADAELRSPRSVTVQGDGRIVVVGDHPSASAREPQGFALARLFGGEAVSKVWLSGKAKMRKGALRLKLSCSKGPGCKGVARGRQVGVTEYAIRGGRKLKLDVPVRENARRRIGYVVKVTNRPGPSRRRTVTVKRRRR